MFVRSLSGTVGLVVVAACALGGCRGPDERPRPVHLTFDAELLARDWEEGPRRDSVEATVVRSGRAFARQLFVSDPMPSGMPSEAPASRAVAEAVIDAIKNGANVARQSEPPQWWKGVPEPAGNVEHDLPRTYVIQVQRGETTALLARWSGREVEEITQDNREHLGSRKWLRPGDDLTITMSANQKLAFDQARERFQQDRLDGYFAKHYIEKVVVYVVQRGDVIARVARQYGETPIWLLEAFNQADFRALQTGDTVLIPVVRELRGGRAAPPKLVVVDKSGRPLTTEQAGALGERLPSGLIRRARMAVDDSNVFERASAEGRIAGADPTLVPAPAVAPTAAAVLPVAAAESAAPPVPTAPAMLPAMLPPARPTAARVTTREVLVKRGETLSHLVAWSGLSAADLVAANPGLDPEHVEVGQKLLLPLTDLAYADFVLARAGARPASPVVARTAPPRTPEPAAPTVASAAPPALPPARIAPAPDKPVVSTRTHTVASGETASGIAARYKVSLGALGRANPGRNLDKLYVGNTLAIPDR
ncbi:MAG: LysM peptidoglycan-binding domain-containing protein [Deltaproteobacteria bacterium]|nr:LysM peptidoglycan-binding domain-containing protein [Deltaproteobacteria bacterium]